MLDKYYNMLNPTETLKKRIPLLKEIFVTFYGEEVRDRVNRLFDSMIIIGYQRPDALEITLNKIEDSVSNDLIGKFLNSISKENTEENRKIFFGTSSLKYFNITPLCYFKEFVEQARTSDEDLRKEETMRMIQMFQKYFPNLTPQNFEEIRNTPKFKKIYSVYYGEEPYDDLITNSIESTTERRISNALPFINAFYPDVTGANVIPLLKRGEFKELESYLETFGGTLEAYESFTKTLESEREYVEKEKEKRENIQERYIAQMVEEFKDLFTEKELEEFRKYGIIGKEMSKYIPFSLEYGAQIEMFSLENDELIKRDDFRASSIKNDRIRFFNSFGINLGTDYEDYVNDTRCKDALPPRKVIEKIVETRKRYLSQSLKEFYESLEEYKKNMVLLKSQDLMCECAYDAKSYQQTSTFVAPNTKRKDGKVVIAPLVCINMEGISEYLDKNILHELNHLFELEIEEIHDDRIDFISGWDRLYQRIGFNHSDEDEDIMEKDTTKREYELFSEIINELLAQDMVKMLFDQNGYMFCDKDNAQIRGGTSYEHTFFLVRNFYEKYKSEIVASRREHNIHIIFDKVGKENFDRLNGLFHKFNKYFSGMNYINMMSPKIKGIETPETLIYDEIAREGAEVFAQMEAYEKKMAS